MDYIHSEINRLETMAGTLSMTELEHFNKLSNFDNRDIMDIAAEEQSAARQLGTMKQMCLAMSQKIAGLKNALAQNTIAQMENFGSNAHD